jgi:hypothetical protein
MSDKSTQKPAQGSASRNSRKERLATALRANLKRRKQARAGGPRGAEDKKTGGRNTDG